jgi:hypothetical protein
MNPTSGRIIIALVTPLFVIGCASSRKATFELGGLTTVTIPFEVSGAFSSFAGHPMLKGTINGVTGKFLIDTGAPGPLLTATAVEKCGIVLSPRQSRGADMWGKVFPLKIATNVFIKFNPDFTVHYAEVLVSPEKSDHFGLLDYGTLHSAHAVMDMERQTITVSK